MLICATMAARPYEDVRAFEATLVVCFDSVLHVGDFGGWPDPKHIDKATNSHDGTGDFSIWLAKQQAVPRRTLFIKGNRTDFVWLDAQNNAEALSELFYPPNGRTIRWRKTSCVRGGGDGVAAFAVCDGGIMLDLSRTKSVRVDSIQRTTRAEGGLPWGAFDHETQTFGLKLRNGRRKSHGHIQKAV
jgi:FAD binding domain